MSSQGRWQNDRTAILAEVKLISGRRIEERRKFRRMTQKELATKVGIGVRWLREIEAGNPKSRIDDHLRCVHGLGLSASHLFIPMLFLEHDMRFPSQILLDDMTELEERWIEFIASFHLRPYLRRDERDTGLGKWP